MPANPAQSKTGGQHGDADHAAAVGFLQDLRPGGPWLVIAIDPDGHGTIGQTCNTAAEVSAFITRYDERCNLYYSVSETRRLNKKATKRDVVCTRFLWTEVDPELEARRAAETDEEFVRRITGEIAAEKAKALSRAKAHQPPPSIIVDSGNGVQLLWRLSGEGYVVKAGEYEPIESRNKVLLEKLGGDKSAFNIDRILRLPGTVNIPTKVKRKAGKVRCATRLIEANAETFSIDAFPMAETQGSARKGNSGVHPGASAADDVRASLPPASLPRFVKTLLGLKDLGAGQRHDKYATRSDLLFAVLTTALRARCDDDTIIEACLDPAREGCAVYEHCEDSAPPDARGKGRDTYGYVERQLERAKAKVAADGPDLLSEMNEKFCVLPIGGKTRVATWGDDLDFPGRETITMVSTFADFRELQDKHRITYEITDKKGDRKKVEVGRGSWWLSQRNRRQYDNGKRFMPDRNEEVVNDTLNLWQGFAVDARKPEGKSGAAGCRLFLDHGLKVICSGDEAHFEYLIKREAWIAQKRARSEVAVCLRTEAEGTGKGHWARTISQLYGRHGMQLLKSDHVLGKFNPHLETLLQLIADEALFASDPRHRDALYGLITEPIISIEPKFVGVYNAKNFLNLYILSNHAHYAPTGVNGRRFFIPAVASDHASDHEYFRKGLVELHDEGGLEALLYHLLHEIEVREFNVRAVPKTAGLAEQAAYSRKGVDALVEKACSEAVVPCRYKAGNFSGVDHADDNCGFDYFIDHHPDRELARLGSLTVKRRLTADWACITGKAARMTVYGKRKSGVVWPELKDLRTKFEAKHGQQNWLNQEVTAWEEPNETAQEEASNDAHD
jgi:hypothetical protein